MGLCINPQSVNFRADDLMPLADQSGQLGRALTRVHHSSRRLLSTNNSATTSRLERVHLIWRLNSIKGNQNGPWW